MAGGTFLLETTSTTAGRRVFCGAPMNGNKPDNVTRWLATLAGSLVAAAIIGMSAIVWSLNARAVALEVKVDTLQTQVAAMDCEATR